jgi:GAF domain-containing protein
MSATAQASLRVPLNRRRRVRQKVHAPAYAVFTGDSADKIPPREMREGEMHEGEMLDLCEVLDISEVGVSVQCAAPMEINRQVDLCLDLAEAAGQVTTTAQVVWSDANGRVGLGLSPLNNAALHRLREWLFLNAMAGAANAEAAAPAPIESPHAELRPTYTDTLAAASAVQREVESLGSDLEAVLSLLAARSQSLLRASGAAIALVGKDEDAMICRASAGPGAPPVGATLQVGSGFSGECVRTATPLICVDAETDGRVDRESCRALGIRSILAAPVCMGDKAIGLLEVFSGQPRAFGQNASAVLQRFAETILTAINRAARAQVPSPPSPQPFVAPPGSVLFAHAPQESGDNKDAPVKHIEDQDKDKDKVGGIRLPRAHLYLLICAAATIALAVGFIFARERLHARGHNGVQTVLASSKAPADAAAAAAPAGPSVDSANLQQLRDMAAQGNAAAEDRLGRLYAEGDDKLAIKPDDHEAAHWFTSAAEHGSVAAQYKLGLLYWGGHHGLPKDANKAYFWTVLARAGGQEGSKDLANFLTSSMTRAQAAAIEQQAEIWYRQHEAQSKASH